MKRRVKIFRQRKNDKVYEQPWIGYSYRNEKGTPCFAREISLVGLPAQEVKAIDLALRHGGDASLAAGVEFLDGQDVGAAWVAYCLGQSLGIWKQLERFDDSHRLPLTAMILDRVIEGLPHSKLSLRETIQGSSLERVIAPETGMPYSLCHYYSALESIYEQQDEIQQALFKKRETVDRMFLYDITSSYFEGTECTLSDYGYNRDGKKGKMQIVIGLLTDSDGRPIAVKVFEGNTCDQSTVMGRIDEMRKDFNINEMVFIGDRGMLTRARREDLQVDEYEKVRYISTLRRQEFFKFLDDQDHPLQLSLFDRQELVEVESDGIRYILSFNPLKEDEDRLTRQRLLAKTEEKLEMIRRNVEKGRWKSEKVIAKRLYAWLNNWNMQRFFTCDYADGTFSYSKNDELIKRYESIDGFYVLTTDVSEKEMDTEEVRKRYKSLSRVEQAFRALKTTDLFVRPIRHWNAKRVQGHVFVCMLSLLISWKARELFSEFISRERVKGKDLSSGECHSLRTLWEKINRAMQIGRFKINGKLKEQLNAMPKEMRPVFKKAGALPTPKKVERLTLVG